MRILCSTFGSAGDVFPMFSLALELRDRGHDVTFATNEHYAGVARRHSIPFEPLGTEADFTACVQNPDLWHPRRAFRHVFESLSPVLRRHYDLHATFTAAGDAVAITNCFGMGAFLAQEKLGLPVITLHCQPAVLWSDYDPPRLPGFFGPRWLQSILFRLGEKFVVDPVVGRILNPWRHELGLPPVSKITRWWNSRFGVLCMFPDWFAPPQPDWPQPLMQTDFPLWNFRADEPLAAEVVRFLDSGDPPLVFTPGSANIHGQSFFAAALSACKTLGRRGIFLTEFPAQLPHPLPESIAHFAFVPLDLLLPKAAAFVHHGGIGSTSQALLAGIPQVLMPLAHDQFDNGQRVRRLNVGDAIPAPRFTAPRLVAALTRLLDQPPVNAACRRAAERLAARDGLRRSADAVEAHLAEKYVPSQARRLA